MLPFDNIFANALELGSLWNDEIDLSPEDIRSVPTLMLKDVPSAVIHVLITIVFTTNHYITGLF